MLGLRGRLGRSFGGLGCEVVKWKWGVIVWLSTAASKRGTGCRYRRIIGAYQGLMMPFWCV